MITILVIVTLVLVAIAGLLYLFKPRPKPKDGEKKAEGKKLEIPQFVKDWWKKKDLEAKRWSLYTAIAIVSITVSYAIGGNDGYAAAAIIALISLHFVWLAYSEKSSLFTKTFITGFLLFYIAAWMVPDVVKIRDASWSMTKKVVSEVAVSAESADKTYGEAPTNKSVEQTAVAKATYQPETRKIEVLATEDEYTEVKIPSGVQFSIDCPDDGLAKVYHRDAQQGIPYDCAQGPIEVGENLHNFRIGFSAKTETPVRVVVRITS